ncbi:MAG: Apolipoprotein N-acyltransferase [Planctomycetota bacterium]|jgi:apolipoprotein N-acyltransferase
MLPITPPPASSGAPAALTPSAAASPAPDRRVPILRDVAVAVGIAAVVAAPWIWQNLVPCEWLGVAAGLVLLPRLRGWRGETLVLMAASLALGTAFHWSPAVLADSVDTSYAVGLAFTVPIVLWDAMRLSLPFWFVSRTVRDRRDAWLPAAFVAVASEAFVTSVFPWKLGYSQIAWPVLVQSADLLGPEAATFILYAHAGVIVLLVDTWLRRREPGRRWTAVGLAAVAVVLANLAYGGWALRHWSAKMAAAPQLEVALVQVDPGLEDGVPALQRASQEACGRAAGGLDLVCWPECSGGSYEEALESFTEPETIFARSREPQRGLRPLEDPACPLLFGGKIYRGYPERPRDLYQSAILVDGAERIVGRYHKRHLMPFGEYIPGQEWLPELRHYFPMDEDLDVGPDANVLDLPGKARLGVMLCYEDMVPAAAASLVDNGADVLVSLINGSSFKATLTLLQHRLLAQLRAVENRRCLLRCAATGETCVVSPLGTIPERLPLHGAGVLTARVPLLSDRPPGRSLGQAFPVACGLFALAIAAVRLWPLRRD